MSAGSSAIARSIRVRRLVPSHAAPHRRCRGASSLRHRPVRLPAAPRAWRRWRHPGRPPGVRGKVRRHGRRSRGRVPASAGRRPSRPRAITRADFGSRIADLGDVGEQRLQRPDRLARVPRLCRRARQVVAGDFVLRIVFQRRAEGILRLRRDQIRGLHDQHLAQADMDVRAVETEGDGVAIGVRRGIPSAQAGRRPRQLQPAIGVRRIRLQLFRQPVAAAGDRRCAAPVHRRASRRPREGAARTPRPGCRRRQDNSRRQGRRRPRTGRPSGRRSGCGPGVRRPVPPAHSPRPAGGAGSPGGRAASAAGLIRPRAASRSSSRSWSR